MPFNVIGDKRVFSTIDLDLNSSVKFEPVKIPPPLLPKSNPNELARPNAPPNPPAPFSSSKANVNVAV
ncbi:hypothetical protein D3C87_1384740 [compost metagenome]